MTGLGHTGAKEATKSYKKCWETKKVENGKVTGEWGKTFLTLICIRGGGMLQGVSLRDYRWKEKRFSRQRLNQGEGARVSSSDPSRKKTKQTSAVPVTRNGGGVGRSHQTVNDKSEPVGKGTASTLNASNPCQTKEKWENVSPQSKRALSAPRRTFR